MTIHDIVFSDATRRLLEENGRMDARNGISKYDGWEQICEGTSYDRGRTPAREAYEDGWHSYRKPEEGK